MERAHTKRNGIELEMLKLSERLNDLSRKGDGETRKIADSKRVQASIVGNITRVINARKNSVAIDRDYGISEKLVNSDFSEIESRHALLREIKAVLGLYEKRLSRIGCELLNERPGLGSLCFLVTAETSEGLLIKAKAKLLADKTFEIETL